MKLPTLSSVLFITTLMAQYQAIHFYMQGSDTKCFVEDLPSETVVVGKFLAEALQEGSNNYVTDNRYTVNVDVVEKNTGNLIVTQKLGATGQFTFTTHEYGEHRVCVSVGDPNSGWFHSTKIKFTLNMFIGSEAVDEKYMPDKVTKIQDRIHVVNSWLHDILYEQEYQRDKEGLFLQLSESVNSRLTLWIILQVSVMAGLCYWQVTHLRKFFINKKLV